MVEQNDMAYLVLRERNARDLSLEPGDIAVRRAHLNIANDYAARILALADSVK